MSEIFLNSNTWAYHGKFGVIKMHQGNIGEAQDEQLINYTCTKKF